MSNGRWRYAILHPGHPGHWIEGGKKPQLLEEDFDYGSVERIVRQLDRAGADGWELVGTENESSSSAHYIFKRPA
jgi:hypothetical protein